MKDFFSQLKPCKPKFILKNGNWQTIWGHYLPSPKFIAEGKYIFTFPDGDKIHCHYKNGASPFVFCFFHGLGGSVESGYMQRSGNIAAQRGHTAILVNHRGAGDGIKDAKKSYHSGACEDVSTVIQNLKNKYPGKKIITVGFSLSANLLLNLLGGHSGSTLPDASISINPPIDLHLTSKSFRKGFNKIYDYQFVKDLKKIIREKHLLGLLDELPTFSPWMKLADFDDYFTAKMAGYSNKDEYYSVCSSKNYLQNIKVPCFILHSANDPFIPITPFKNANFSSSTVFHLEKNGGHLGYLTSEQTSLGSNRWLDYFLDFTIQKLEDHL